jgi:hypothetical protein
MKCTTEHLLHAELNYAIAKALMFEITSANENAVSIRYYSDDETSVEIADYTPSTEWCYLGPLIERFKVQLEPMQHGLWIAKTDCLQGVSHYTESIDDSALIAACRAIAMSLLGSETEIPYEVVRFQNR